MKVNLKRCKEENNRWMVLEGGGDEDDSGSISEQVSKYVLTVDRLILFLYHCLLC